MHMNTGDSIADSVLGRRGEAPTGRKIRGRFPDRPRRVGIQVLISNLLCAAKSRAQRGNMAYSLSLAWGIARWTGRCEVTGDEFVPGDRVPGPYSPSIDKIDPLGGYTKENCRFVTMRFNSTKNATSDRAVKLAMYTILSRRREREETYGFCA